jgi:predicted Ser/Thr protein kinase
MKEPSNIDKAMQHFDRTQRDRELGEPISFVDYLDQVTKNPGRAIRNVFQVFHDMIEDYVDPGVDEYAGDPESIHYVDYNTGRLFVEGSDHPFFADRLFANRLVSLAENFRHGSQQNKIYIFLGPHGCGKSTFLDNLLMKFEQYANTESGFTFETVWRLDRKILGSPSAHETGDFLSKLSTLLDEYELRQSDLIEAHELLNTGDEYIEAACPSHDNPILMIPREDRRSFFDDLFKNDEAKWKLFTEKQYDWVFSNRPCTICSSIYSALLRRLKSPTKVLQMLHARPYRFSRRLGEGISVYNPGDRIVKQNVLVNELLQNRINALLRDSKQVRYIYSNFAKTNNGIYALMDIKGHNVERLMELHNIISEGLHKVEDIEENVNSLLLALMNPEDQANIVDFPSFSDRIEYINIPYVLDLRTEVAIYRNTFGRHIENRFLPRVLHNFARVIISTRLNQESPAMKEWIGPPDKYSSYCDRNLQLLKMEIYTGNIPDWLSEEDRKGLTAKRRQRIIGESEKEGAGGFSGRDSIKIFSEFFSTYAREGSLIDMTTLCRFFTKQHQEWKDMIPDGFLDSLLHMYDYTILQEIKESLYYYNEEQIARDIQNYLFAVNFELGSTATCTFTGDKLTISEDLLVLIENRLISAGADREQRLQFRQGVQKEYTSRTLTQELLMEEKPITATGLYRSLHDRYVYRIKEKVLDPFLENENFRRAIKDFGNEDFKTYDRRIREDVSYLIENLCTKFNYSKLGAREACIYLIDNELAKKFATA